jgi:hypothetical protein
VRVRAHRGLLALLHQAHGAAHPNDGTRKGEVRFPDGFDESAKGLILGLLERNTKERVACQGLGVVEVFDAKFEYFRTVDMGPVRRCEHAAPWLPEPNHIYALTQSEIRENDDDGATIKVKLLPEDEIPFEPFMVEDDHQRDIIKVLSLSITRASIEAHGALDPLASPPYQGTSACCTLG